MPVSHFGPRIKSAVDTPAASPPDWAASKLQRFGFKHSLEDIKGCRQCVTPSSGQPVPQPANLPCRQETHVYFFPSLRPCCTCIFWLPGVGPSRPSGLYVRQSTGTFSALPAETVPLWKEFKICWAQSEESLKIYDGLLKVHEESRRGANRT